MKRGISFSFLLLLLICVLALSTLATLHYLVTSPAGNDWTLQQLNKWVPGLTISNASGQLDEALSFDLIYQDESVSLTIDRANISLDAKCLWQLAACVKQLSIETLIIDIPEISESNSDTESEIQQRQATEFSRVTMPVLLKIKTATLGKLLITGANSEYYRAEQITFSGRWIDHRIRLIEVTAQDDYCDWRFPFSIRLTGFYQIKADMSCNTEMYPLKQLQAKVDGDLRQLAIRFETNGDLAAKGKANLALLSDKLPIDFNLQLLSPFSPSTDEISFEEAILSGQGNLDNLVAQASAKLSSPRLAYTVNATSDLAYDWQSLSFDKLLVRLPEGSVESRGNLTIADSIQWQGESHLHQVALSQIESTLEGELNGLIKHAGKVATQSSEVNAPSTSPIEVTYSFSELNGILYGQSWQAKGNGKVTATALTATDLTIRQGKNWVNLKGKYGFDDFVSLTINSDIAQLKYIIPSLSGSLQGKVIVAGKLFNPEVKGTLQANNFSYQTYSAKWAKLNFDWQPASELHNQVKLNFRHLSIANTDLDFSGKAVIQGQLEDHRVFLKVTDLHDNQADIDCHGVSRFDKDSGMGQWGGDCYASELNVGMLQPNQRWKLSQPIAIDIQSSTAIGLNMTVSPFCYQYQSSQVCHDETLSIVGSNISPIRITGKHLDLAWAKAWMPQNINASGTINSHAQINFDTAGYDIEVNSKSENLHVDITQNENQVFPIDMDEAQLQAKFGPEKYQLQWFFTSATAGKNQGTITINEDQLVGKITFEQIQVEPFSNLAQTMDDEYMEGLVSGELSLSGLVHDPQIQGEVHLTEGVLHSERLPLPVNNIAIKVLAKDKEAKVRGRFLVDGKPGKIKGIFNWQQPQWWSNINLKSETIAIQPDENIKVYFDPNLEFNITPTAVHLDGELFVPKARIYLKSLPEQAITVSGDAEVIGEETTQNSEYSITSKLSIKLGDDVKFNGFGLDTNLTGNMQITQKRAALMRAKGIVRLEKGVYKAYGQSLVISDGDLIFIDDIENPQLRLSATRDNVVDDVVVGIRVTGRASRPEITVFSIPEMPQQEKFHYLLTGRGPNTDSNTDPSNVAKETALALALESNSGLTRKAGEKLGIEDLTLTTSTTENRSEVGVSGYITPDLMIKYGVGMFEAVNSLTLNYRLRQNLFFEVISGKSNAFDILWSFDKD